MKDPKDVFKNNEPSPALLGGVHRPSIRVDIKRFDSIRRRQELNALLLQRVCTEEEEPALVLEKGDKEILMQIARERDPNMNPIIRKHAIQSLGQFPDLKVAEFLWGIATAELEHQTVRAQSIRALTRIAPRMASNLLQRFLEDESAILRQTTVNMLGEIGDKFTIDSLTNLLEIEQDPGVRISTTIALKSLGEKQGVRVPSVKVPRRPKKARTPKSEGKGRPSLVKK